MLRLPIRACAPLGSHMAKWARIVLNNLLVIVPGAIAATIQLEGAFDLLRQEVPSICTLALGGPATCKLSVQLEILVLGVLLNFIYQVVEVQLPTLEIVEVRKTVLGVQLAPIFEAFKKAYAAQAKDTPVAKSFARVTVMVPRRTIRGLWLRKDFEFVHQSGFEDYHEDVDLTLFSGQGVAGEAMRLRRPVAQGRSRAGEHLRGWWRFKSPWGMSESQLKSTSHVHWVLSVPMIKKASIPGRKSSVVGVINIDVVDKNLAAMLDGVQVDTDPVLGPIVESLLLAGYIGAALW
ncbi:hypothetical protein [Pyxidicoccus xibeiensis]|uniref:hypothetical protein n=1 Tax=Pyxidicoccus xibeiensis TaxID=2906759 RepID=UPI0020A7114D|nr:hypothetical protein [Pyxidicoccus xibeiensis]MCP3139025.1 hypothetical protein [Pyxidicoccus xibeiensis]